MQALDTAPHLEFKEQELRGYWVLCKSSCTHILYDIYYMIYYVI